jgi:MraZ protein
MYSPKTWDSLTQRFPDDPFPTERERDIERWFFANADFLDLDKSGRCILPDGLKKEVGISDKVVLVGVRNRVEAWAPDRWEAFKARVGPNYNRTIEVIHQLAAKDRPLP